MIEKKVDPTIAIALARELTVKSKLNLKILKCEQTDQGLTFYYLTPERSDLRPISRDLNRAYKIKINFKELSPQEAADLIPGYASCGHRLSWMSDACGNLWECTCDPTAKQNKGTAKETDLPPVGVTAEKDIVVEDVSQSTPLENQADLTGGVGERESKKDRLPTDKHNKKKKLIRRLVLK